MMRRTLILLCTCTLLVFLVAPADANRRGSVYERDRYNDHYSFRDDGCGFVFQLKGRAWGRYVIHNVRGSDGQAFVINDRYHYRNVLTNPRNGKTMYISGSGRFRERDATHVRGDVWEFIAVDRGRPFRVKNGRKEIVLADRGKVVLRQLFDTRGDSKPGGKLLKSEVLRHHGNFPSLEPGFDFCDMAKRLIG